MSLDEILSRIKRSDWVSPAELLPFLCLEGRQERADVNLLLANAHLEAGGIANLEQAKVFIDRAWHLGKFDPATLPSLIEIQSRLGNVSAIREAYKRVGLSMASAGNVAEAIKYFNLWQYAYAQFEKLDRFDYDYDILDAVERLARPYRFAAPPDKSPAKNDPIRVAYLVKGIGERRSILVAINLLFAQYHDRKRIEPLFFVPESENTVMVSPAAREQQQLFRNLGCEVTLAPNLPGTEDRLLAVAKSIHDAQPDILVTDAALAYFEHCFITYLRPAPHMVGLLQGPPPQFAPPMLDWAISWSKHPLMDCPVDSSLFCMEHHLPERRNLKSPRRSNLGIPEDALLVVSAGRYPKFQEQAFWRAIADLLSQHPNMYYLLLGLEPDKIPFLSEVIPAELNSRVKFQSWLGDDYLEQLNLADIMIDTFPSGGGSTLVDAMALEIPIVSFRNNYLRPYDQTDWSPAEEMVSLPDLIVTRGDYDEMKRVVARLIGDPDYRHEMGREGREKIQAKGDPARAVGKLEDLYFRLLEKEFAGRTSRAEAGSEVESLKRRLGSLHATPSWKAWTAHQLKRGLWFGERTIDRILAGKK